MCIYMLYIPYIPKIVYNGCKTCFLAKDDCFHKHFTVDGKIQKGTHPVDAIC